MLTGDCSYILSEDKDARSVADFIQIVIGSISGFNIDIDINSLKRAIAEVSFGLCSEKRFDSGGIKITVSGNTKSSTMVTLSHN